MLSLLVVTVITSFTDSLNPVALTQQFLLQGLVRKPRHIWAYIAAVGLTNLVGGLLAYYGLSVFISTILGSLFQVYSQQFFIAELIVGMVMLIGVCYLLLSRRITALQQEVAALKGVPSEDGTGLHGPTRSCHPASLFLLGIVGAVSELPTALPYFAFLAVLLNYQLTLPAVLGILLLYNLIYCLPLMLLYALYRRLQAHIDRLYAFIKRQLTKVIGVLLPILVGGIGLFCIYHGIRSILQ